VLPTTAAVLEILIVGVEALIWLSLLVLAVLPRSVDTGTFAGSSALAIALAGLLAYALGVVVDRAADSLYTYLRKTKFGETILQGWIGDPPSPRPVPPVGAMRLRTMAPDDGPARFLEYQRSRLRIARATAFNLSFALVVLPLFLLARTHVGTFAVAGVEVVVLGVFIGSVVGTERIGDAYHGRLSDLYMMWANEHEELAAMDTTTFGIDASKRCRRFAAVPYRIAERGIEFLLVRTGGGRHWTFPKGKKKDSKKKQQDKEKDWQAALRETEEEAGVTGEIDRHAFATYRFPSDGGKCDEHVVRAYLLRVTPGDVERRGDDAKREVRWVPPSEARALLGEDRSPDYASSHAHVIDAAVERLGGAS